jgi:3-hydroxybutyrate dehydrogenase
MASTCWRSTSAEVAGVVSFLLGPDGRAFTGAPVTMDLGWTAR